MQPIPIPKDNDFELQVPIEIEGEGKIPASDLSNVSVYTTSIDGRVDRFFRIVDDEISIPFVKNSKPIIYDVHIVANHAGRQVGMHWKDLIKIVPFGMAVPVEVVHARGVIIRSTMTDEEFEQLKQDYREKIAEAEGAKREFDEAKDEADAVAYEAVHGIPERFDGLKEDVKEAVKEGLEGNINNLKIALQGEDATATLTAIKAIVEAIPTATYTDALAAIQQVVDALPKTTLGAQDKSDIIAAIQAATPTIDFTEVLNAISASETAIKAAMPDVSGLADAKTMASYQTATMGELYNVKSAAEAAKAAAEGIPTPPTAPEIADEVEKKLPTDYAKEGTFTAWVNGLWSQFVSRIETAVAGLAKPSDIPSVADVQNGLAKEANATTNKADILTAIAGVQASAYKGVPTIAASGNITAMPNQLYVWSSPVGAFTITKGAETAGIVNEYIFRFSGATSVVFAGWSLTWNGGDAPSWEASKTYEISIVDNIALYA